MSLVFRHYILSVSRVVVYTFQDKIFEKMVSSLETSTELDVIEIQHSRENQPRLTKRWATVSNLAEQSGNEMIRSRTLNETKSSGSYFMEKRKSQALTENAQNLSDEEMELLEMDIFKPLDFYDILFSRMKINGKKTHAKRVTFAESVVVIRFY